MAKITHILATNVKYLRGNQSQVELAEKAGVKVSLIRAVESERTWPGTENIGKLAAALGVEESDLFRADGLPSIVYREHDILECNRRVQKAIKDMLS